MHSNKNESIIKYKLLYTAIILIIYMIGRGLPLYGIDFGAYADKSAASDEILLQTISGDIYQCSIFALGISPYMMSMIIVQIVSAFINSDKHSKISPTKMAKFSLAITVGIAVLQSFLRVRELQFLVSSDELNMARMLAFLEMITGAVLIVNLLSGCKRFGFGGQSILVMVNVIDSVRAMFASYDMSALILPLGLSILAMIITVIMENAEKRIPVQRISIHNIYADKNYMAIKLNPIGVMPAMFSTAFFMLPQILLTLLGIIMPSNLNILWCIDNMSLSKPLGIVTYIVILYLLTIGFSRVFISPSNITEQYLKSGDSIVNLHAGKETRRYLSRTINGISVFSATLMSVCLIIPIILNVHGHIDSGLVMLPSMTMMLTGLWCNLYREFIAIQNLESYKPFI